MTGPASDCPRCAVTTRPYRADFDPGGLRAHYRCGECGKRWHTGWLLSEDEMARYGSAA